MRNRTLCKNKTDSDWHAVKDLYAGATAKAKALGSDQLCRRNSIACQLYVYKSPHKKRHHLTAQGDTSRQSANSRANANREKEPWLLATSLTGCLAADAKKVTQVYATRMQIEKSFRDLKSGLNLNDSNTRNRHRLSILLLLAMLGQFVLYLLGLAVKVPGKQKRYQANSLNTDTILSNQFIGLRAFKDCQLRLKRCDWLAAYLKIQELIAKPLGIAS